MSTTVPYQLKIRSFIPNRFDARKMPMEVAVIATQSKLNLDRLTGGECPRPFFHNT